MKLTLTSAAGLYLLVSTSGFPQGSLTPPGAPAPTMKTLDQLDAKLEKRIPIDAANTPGNATATFRITASGSYYLTGNITGESGKDGIRVEAAGVTIDLNGFAVAGVPGSLNGIDAGGITGTSIRNGYVTGWPNQGVVLSTASRAEHITANTNNIGMFFGFSAVIVDCIASSNTAAGITASAGSVVRSSTALSNGGNGIEVSETGSVFGCVARFNQGTGFKLGSRTLIQSCVSALNKGDGIGIESGSVLDCLADSNSLDGIHNTNAFGLHVERCSALYNSGDGIQVSTGSVVANNGSKNNSAAGIRVETGQGSRIDNNNVSDNARGIEVVSDRNMIVRNTCRNNGGHNFVIAAGNRIAQIIVPVVNAAIDGDTGSGFTSTDPWANFTY